MRTKVVIKKYGNRRLYDTAQSRYVTLEEVADVVRGGADVQVLDAGTQADLTQATLTQILIEGGSAERLLPAPLLQHLIRLHDPAVATLMGQWLSQAVDAYLTGQGLAESVTPFMPAASAPFAATNALARMMAAGFGLPSAFGLPGFGMHGFGLPGFGPPPPPPSPAAAPPADTPSARDDDVAELRRELQALRRDFAAGPTPDRPARPRRRKPS